MELIVDANVLLAAFLKDATTRELLLDARLNLFAPEHLLTEVNGHLKSSAELRRRISLPPQALQELFGHLTQRIQTVPAVSYKNRFSKALSLAPDRKDAHYFALALLLEIPIWSNDKAYKNQTKMKVYSTSELIEVLGRRP